MQSLIDTVMNQIGNQDIRQLSSAVGEDEDRTRDALGAALPMILAGLARNASRPDGAAALNDALAKDHDGSLLDHLSGFMGRGETTTGEKILGHVFGGRKPVVEQGVSKASGIDAAKAAKIMAMAAPLVMAALGKQRRERQLDAGALSRELQVQDQQVRTRAPQLGGLASLLDADKDGSIADDIVGGLGKLFGR